MSQPFIRCSLLSPEKWEAVRDRFEDWVERHVEVPAIPGFDPADLMRLKGLEQSAYASAFAGAPFRAASFSAFPAFLAGTFPVRDLILKGIPLSPPPADISLEELYELLSKPDIEKVYVIFHASWCKPCKTFKTVDYQSRIRDFNAENARTPIVMVGLESDNPSLEWFAGEVVAQSIVVNDRASGVSSTIKQPVLPALITIDARSKRYLFRSVNDVKASRIGPQYFVDLSVSAPPEERNESQDGTKEYVFIDQGWQDLVSRDELNEKARP